MSSIHEQPKQNRLLLQLIELRFGVFQDGDIGVGVFPQFEEVLVLGAGLGGVAGYDGSTGKTEMGQYLFVERRRNRS